MKHIRLGKAVKVSGMSLMPVERVVIDGHCHLHGVAIAVEYAPIGIILDDGTRRWAMGIRGEPLEPDELIKC